MTRHLCRSTARFWSGFVAGFASLASFAVPPTTRLTYPHRSEMEAMRADWFRIGDDMADVIERERRRVEARAH